MSGKKIRSCEIPCLCFIRGDDSHKLYYIWVTAVIVKNVTSISSDLTWFSFKEMRAKLLHPVAQVTRHRDFSHGALSLALSTDSEDQFWILKLALRLLQTRMRNPCCLCLTWK